jgi:hypothetical protein
MSIRPLFIAILLIITYGVRAQRAEKDTLLKGSTIEVLQSYKPVIKPAPKPEWIPQLPPADTTHPVFNYEVPQQTLYYTYSSLPLRPLAMGREIIPLPFANYVKLGGGNLSTLFLDAGIGGISGKNYETDIHLHHISQKGNIKYQQTSLSGIEAEGFIHNPKAEWHMAVNGERNQYYYYGYPHDLYNYSGTDSLKQTYTTVRVAADMKNGANDKSKFTYNPAINASLYSAAFNTRETNIGIHVPLEYKFDNTVQALLAVSGDFVHLSVNNNSGADNNLAAFMPGVRVHLDEFTGHAIIGFAFGIKNNNYVLPDLNGTLEITDHTFISAGYQSTIRQNTYEQLTTENPYLMNTYSLMQTKRDEIYGELRGGAGAHFTYSGRISWWNFTALPTYLNNFWDNRQFYIVYDNVQALAFQLSARYKVANKWSAGLAGNFYSFSTGVQQHAWHQPPVRVMGDFTAAVLPKLSVSAYLSLLAGIYALDASSKAVVLDPVFDVGGGAEYQLIKRLSAFVQIDNLLNNTNQRWYRYNAYGFNIYGGLRLKF